MGSVEESGSVEGLGFGWGVRVRVGVRVGLDAAADLEWPARETYHAAAAVHWPTERSVDA